jgi:putative ABC transport system permease protein
MGQPNVALLRQTTIITLFEDLGLPKTELRPLVMAVVVLVVALLLWRFLVSEYGLAMRATGANPRMARAQGIETKRHTYVGMALSNAIVALGGAFFAQTAGFADVTTGAGTIVVGLAAVILGETLFRTRRMLIAVLACVVGSILYRIALALALNTDWIGLEASDLNLVTAVLVGIALVLPRARGRLVAMARRGAP